MLTIHQGSAAQFFPALSREMFNWMPKYTGMTIPDNDQRSQMEEALREYAQNAPEIVMNFLDAQQSAGHLSFAQGRKENVRSLIEDVCQEALQKHQVAAYIT